MDILNEIIII